jgi:hypothetical protein
MGKASSSKKVARAARAGGRRASGGRQRDLKFPAVIGLIVLLGSGLIAFAANDRKSDAAIHPIAGEDHWHAAFGVYICGEFQPNVPLFESPIGIHTHDDGVIHIHPTSGGGAGENATLGAFLDGAGIDLSDSTLKMNDETWKEGDDQCDGEDTELVVAQWKDVQDPASKPALILRDFNDIRFRQNGEGYTIAFVPEGTTDIPKPPSAANLAELGAADAGGTGTTQPTAPGDTGSTVPADPTATTAPAAADPTATTAPADPTATTAPGG